jgi:hypothetical protein
VDAFRIVLGMTVIACLLGVIVDLVTAHVAVQYLVHHPKIVESHSPVVLALAWGVGASWWFGSIAGGLLALVNARAGNPLQSREILTRGAWAAAWIWVAMIAVLVCVYAVGGLIPASQRRPTFESDRRLVAVAMAHQGEYLFGAIATVVIAMQIVRQSRKPRDRAAD